MSRLIRLTCPACRTLIETSVEEELRVTVLCAACHKQFTAKVPVAARPAQATAASPISARPVLAPGRLSDADPLDPLFNVPPDDKIPVSPAAYKPMREYPPLDLRPVLVIVSSLIGMLLAIFLALYIWHWVANTDWSTFSVIPDSHERLTDEWFERNERDATENAKQMGEGTLDIEQAKRRIAEAGSWSEDMLVRAVRLGKAPLEKKAAFKERQDALDKKTRSQLDAKLAELKASGKQPGTMPDLWEVIRQTPGIQDTMILVFALPGYMRNALFDLPAPANEIERLYYEEADLVHVYLKQLTMVRNTSQSIRVAEKIQELADKVMELAIKRSKMPANRFEQVPREYVSKDKGFEAAQKALVARIRRDAKPDEKLKDAVANFNDARDLLLAASDGVSDVTLRSRFADARKLRSQSTKRGPGDLFLEVVSDPSERELVIKPRRQSQPDPVLDPPQAAPKPPTIEPRPIEPRSQPIPETVVSNTPSAPTSIPTNPFDSPAANPTISTDPPQLNTGAPPASSPRPFDRREQAMQGVPPNMRPNLGPPIDGRGMVYPSQGFGAPLPGYGPGTMGPPLDKAESVKIIITSNKRNGDAIVKRLASQLESNTYQLNDSNGKITLQIKYTGELNRVVKLIDFGRVTLIDTPERTIHVVGE